MAQDGPINLPVDCTNSPSGSEVSQDQPAKTDTLPASFAPQPLMDQNGQQSLTSSQLNPEPRAIDDDDVQFVFSAPRRRKRKRKRLDFSYLPSMLNQCSIPPKPPLNQCNTTPRDPLRRRSLGVLEQLESCHIGARDVKDHAVRSGSLPIAPSITAPVLSAQTSSLPGPICAPTLESLSRSAPIPLWTESKALSLNSPVNLPAWRPIHTNGPVTKKRKIDSELATAETHHLIRQSPPISPRTTPASTLPPSDGYARDSAMDTSDMPWTWGLSSVSENPPPDHRVIGSWLDFDWNALDKLGTAQYASQPLHQAMPMNFAIAEKQSTSLLHQPRIAQSDPRHIRHQNETRVSSPQKSHLPTFEFSQTSGPYQNSHHQLRPQQRLSHGSTAQMNLCIPPLQQLRPSGSNDYNNTSRVSANIPTHPHANKRKQNVTSPSSTRINFPHMRTESADLLRRPSLYTIPAWPGSDDKTVQLSMTTSPQESRPSTSNTSRNGGFQKHISLNTSRIQCSRTMQSEKPIGRNSANIPLTGATIASSNTKSADKEAAEAAEADVFELPRAHAGRKHCPNLVVDIAETCQELFPFAEVAERHNVPIKKVFDTFSAIIQLPLLRNADDRRRHGSLGKRRMKEYRDARKAMEKAQEAERKTQMKAIKASFEEARKKGKGQANAPGLLKAAILNNATQCQAGPKS